MSNRKGLQVQRSNSFRFLLKPVGKISPHPSVTSSYYHKKSASKPRRQNNSFEGQMTPQIFESYKNEESKCLLEQKVRTQTQKSGIDFPTQVQFSFVEDPRKSEFSYRKYIFMQKMLLYLTLFSFFLNLVSIQMYVLQNTIGSSILENQHTSLHIDMLSSLVTGVLIMTLFMRYVCLNELQIDQKKFYCKRTCTGFFAEIYRFLIQKDSLKQFLIQFLIILPHPFFLFHDDYIYLFQSYDQIMLKHKVNDILKVMTLFRSYMVVRAMITLTIYSTPRASRLCSHNRINHSILYSVKCLLRQQPLRIITLVFIVQETALSLGLKIAEGSLIYSNPGIQPTGFENYQNCFWCVFIAMSTVGYGDYFPKTLPGRVFIIMAAVSGILLSSLLIVSLSQLIKISFDISQTSASILTQIGSHISFNLDYEYDEISFKPGQRK